VRAAPEVEVELEVDPDQVLDAIDAASVDADETRVDGRTLYLPLTSRVLPDLELPMAEVFAAP
jgi:hypothetical protein